MSGKQQLSGQGGGSNYNNIKFVKPSELSLDLISPNNQRLGVKGSHGLPGNLGGRDGNNTSTHSNNQNMSAILQNYRTPQNINNSQMKELPGIHGASNA